MKILTAYTLKYLRLNKKRTAVTILGVVLSTALICGVLLLGGSFQEVMIDHEIFMNGNWHAQFHSVPFNKAKYITENSAVQTAMLSEPLGNALFGGKNSVRPYLMVRAYDSMAFQNQSIRLISGRLPQSEDELIVSQSMVTDSGLGLKPGSTVTLTFGTRVIPNHDELVKAWGGEEYVALQDAETFTPSSTKVYTIVGITEPLSDETAMPADFPALTYLDVQQLKADDLVDIAILARNPRQISTSVLDLAKAAGLTLTQSPDGQVSKKSISFNEGLLPWIGASGRSNYSLFYLVIITTLITLIVCGSALVIYNAFAISIRERKKQFGMFASVGATAAQIRRIVLTEAGMIALIGIPLGVLGSITGVGLLLKLTQGVVAQLIADASQGMPLVISPFDLLLTVLFSGATTLISAWIPARRASQVSPIEAIRLSGEIEDGKQTAHHANPLFRRLFGFEGELAIKSLQRDRKRYLTTLLSLMISIILFVAFNALMLYTNTTQNLAVQAMNYDLQIDLDYHQSHAKDFANLVSQLPEVQRLTFRRSTYELYVPKHEVITDQAYRALQELNKRKLEYIPQPVDGETFAFVIEVSAVGPAEFAHYTSQLGLDLKDYTDPLNPLGILVNHSSLRQSGKMYDYDLFNLKPGDTITVSKIPEYTPPQTEGEPISSFTWKIGATTDESPLGLMGSTTVPEFIVSDEVFDALSDQLIQVGPINPGGMTLKSDNPEAALKEIKQLYQSTVGGNFSYYSMADFNKASQLQTLMMNLFFYGFLTLITLIGVANIVNTLDTNIKLRRREIAMLKSVGLTPGGFKRMLWYESLFYGLIALLYGLPAGILLSVIIYFQFNTILSTFSFSLPWVAIAGCVVGILVIVFATMMVSGAMIRNDNIVDALKDENL